MKNGELIEYLKQFDPELPVRLEYWSGYDSDDDSYWGWGQEEVRSVFLGTEDVTIYGRPCVLVSDRDKKVE